MSDAIVSLIQNACHTPLAPKNLDNTQDTGMMTIIQRSAEITRDGFPFPRPSNTPQTMTEMEEMTNEQFKIIIEAIIQIVKDNEKETAIKKIEALLNK